MDTSGTYISMCKKAREIQELSPGKGEDNGFYYMKGEEYIWLPRQDQLQEMITNTLDIWMLFTTFGDWCNEWGGEAGKYNTGEQLWLVYVMQYKFNKVWDGTAWRPR